MPFYPSNTSEGKAWSGAGSTYSLVQTMRQEHAPGVITLGRHERITKKAPPHYRYGMAQIEPPNIPEPQTVVHQTKHHTGKRLQESFVPESTHTVRHRRARYPASVPNNVPGYVAPVAVTTGYDMPAIDLHPVRVYAPEASFRCTPYSVHYLPSHPRLESRSMSRFSKDSYDEEFCESFEEEGVHGKTEDMGHVRSFTQSLSWNRKNGSTCDGKAVHREEAESNTWLRRFFRQNKKKMGIRDRGDRQPETPPNTPEDRVPDSKRPAASGELDGIPPGYPVKRPRTTGGHSQDIPMGFVRASPPVRASHQEPPVRISSRWFPTWKNGKPPKKPFEHPRYTAYFGNKRAVTELGMSVF